MVRTVRWGVWGGLGSVLTAALVGCSGGEGRVPVYPVAGKVTVKGETPAGALVVFHPAGGSADAVRPTGKVRDDGTFAVTTYDGEDGAPAGDYAVTVQWNKLVKKGNDYQAGPNAVPQPYSHPDATPWKVKIAAARNDLEPRDLVK